MKGGVGGGFLETADIRTPEAFRKQFLSRSHQGPMGDLVGGTAGL